MTVAEMMHRMTSAELSGWLAFSSVEPIGDDREDFRMAMLCSLIANVNRDPAKRAEPFTPMDFIVNFWKQPESEPDPDAGWKRNLELARVINEAMGGAPLRKETDINGN
jgi:hypothetical protein